MRTTLVEQVLAASLERWLRSYVALLPQSSPLDEPISSAAGKSGDDRIVRMMELAEIPAVGVGGNVMVGDLLRPCTQRQQRILLRRQLHRRHIPRTQRVGWVDVPCEGATAECSREELARAEGLSVPQYKRELTRALEAVGHAIAVYQQRREAA